VTAADIPAGVGVRSKPSWRGLVLASLLATLGHPRWWAIALAAFLVRGGVIVVLLPIVAAPSVATLTGILSPIVTPVLLGGNLATVLPLALAASIAFVIWVVVGGWLGAWFDTALAAEAAADEDLDLGVSVAGRPSSTAVTARVVPHLVTLVAAGIGALKLISATYGELLSPSEPAVPLAIRIVRAAPESLILLAGAWLLAEAVGSLAHRHVVMSRSSGPQPGAWRAIRDALDAVTRPRGFATLVLGQLIVIAAIVPGWVAAARAWSGIRVFLADGALPGELAAALGLLVGSWLGGLCLLGVALASRATLWSGEAARGIPAD